MPGAPKLQSLLEISIGQNNQLFMGNILATSDFFYSKWYFRLHVNRKKWMPQKFNMTLPFITFFQKCSRNIRLKIVGSLDFLYVLSRCRKCWPFSYWYIGNALENPFFDDLDPDQIPSSKMDLDPDQIQFIYKRSRS